MLWGEALIHNPVIFRSYVLDLAIWCLRKRWPHAMVETPGGHFFPAHWRLPFGIVDEFLVYKDPASRETWLSIPNTMVELRCLGEELEVVVDDSKDPVMSSFLQEVRLYLHVAFGWNGPFTTAQMLS